MAPLKSGLRANAISASRELVVVMSIRCVSAKRPVENGSISTTASQSVTLQITESDSTTSNQLRHARLSPALAVRSVPSLRCSEISVMTAGALRTGNR